MFRTHDRRGHPLLIRHHADLEEGPGLLGLTGFREFLSVVPFHRGGDRLAVRLHVIPAEETAIDFPGFPVVRRYHHLLGIVPVPALISLGLVRILVAEFRILLLVCHAEEEGILAFLLQFLVLRLGADGLVFLFDGFLVYDLPFAGASLDELVVEVLAVRDILGFLGLVEGDVVDTDLFVHVVCDLVAGLHIPVLYERGDLFLELQFLFGSEGGFFFGCLPFLSVVTDLEEEEGGEHRDDEGDADADEGVFEKLLVS